MQGAIPKQKLTLVKAGGEIFDNVDDYSTFLEYFYNIPGPKLMVHGCGRQIDDASKFYNQKPEKYDGMRVTRLHELTIMLEKTSVLNTQIVNGLNNMAAIEMFNRAVYSIGANVSVKKLDIREIATGIPMVGDYVYATKRPVQIINGDTVDFQYVGDLHNDSINISLLNKIIESDEKIPIIPPTAYATDINVKVNVNADTVAAMTAAKLNEGKFDVLLELYCANVPGVMIDIDNPETVINQIDAPLFHDLIAAKIVKNGMIKKIKCGLDALNRGVGDVFIRGMGNRGTRIVKEIQR